jgi:hypothetical protein
MTWFNSGIDDNPDLDLQEFMDRMFDDYPDEFRRYWGLDAEYSPEYMEPDDWERYQRLDNVARRVAHLAVSLARPPRLPEADLELPLALRAEAARGRAEIAKIVDHIRATSPDDRGLFLALASLKSQEEVDHAFFRSALQIYLAEYLVWPSDLASRVVTLTKFAARVQGQLAREFLGRVSRCYLYAMDAELAVMARAALAAVLEHYLDETQVRNVRHIPRHLRIGLADYIEVADGTLLPESAARSARKLKQWGDDAAHVSPQLVGSRDEILEHLTAVLKELEKRN